MAAVISHRCSRLVPTRETTLIFVATRIRPNCRFHAIAKAMLGLVRWIARLQGSRGASTSPVSTVSGCRGRPAGEIRSGIFAFGFWLVRLASRSLVHIVRLVQLVHLFFVAYCLRSPFVCGCAARSGLVSRSFAIWTSWRWSCCCVSFHGALQVSGNRRIVVCSRRSGRWRRAKRASATFGAHHTSHQSRRGCQETRASVSRPWPLH